MRKRLHLKKHLGGHSERHPERRAEKHLEEHSEKHLKRHLGGRLEKQSVGRWAKRAACAALAAMVTMSLCGCKPTEFFVEKIIVPQAEQVDQNNENTILVNSPDAEQESTTLSALDWTDDSLQTQSVENLVTWSNTPNSIMTTHHSVFDIYARFPGILASDGVVLQFDTNAVTQGQANVPEDANRDDVTAVGTGTSTEGSDTATSSGAITSNQTISGDDATDDTADNGADPSETVAGDGSEGNKEGAKDNGSANKGNTPGSGSGTSETTDPDSEPTGRTPDYSGYGGNVKWLSPDSKKDPLPKADSVAVIGTQVAVTVQSLGGKGAIIGMSDFDYNYNSNGEAANYTGSFKGIFGENPDEWDASSVYMWSGGASTSEEVDFSGITDAEAFAKGLGFDAVVFYDQTLVGGGTEGDIESLLSEDLKYETYGYNITFIPLDFSTVKDMLESVDAISQVMGGSSVAAQDITEMAKEYTNLVSAVTSELSNVIGINKSGVWLNIATDACFATPVKKGSTMSLGKQLVMFADYGQDAYTPLNTWILDAGVNPMTVGNTTEYSVGRGHLALLDPSGGSFDIEGSGSVLSWWMEVRSTGEKPHNSMTADQTTTTVGRRGGLGSSEMPYLVVTGTSDGALSATEVRDQARTSVKSYILGRGATLYAAMSNSEANNAGFGKGTTIGKPGGQVENILTDPSLIDGTVRANPDGVLGSWTDASFESVLESVWLAALYSQSPGEGSVYVPDSDWGGFSVTLGDTTISGNNGMDVANSLVSSFYSRFYRTSSYTAPDLEG